MKQRKLGKRKCKNCKEIFQKKEPLQMCCGYECALEYSRKENEKKKKAAWSKRKAKIKESLKPKQDYEKDLEKVFNEWIRVRDKDKPCISCGAPAGTYTLTAGHYYPAGSYKNIRFDSMNVNGQCWWNCNKNKSGNLSEYRLGLIDRYGIDKVRDLDERRLSPRRFTIPELEEMIKEYKLKLKQYGKY